MARTPALWPPGPHALAAAAVKTIESMAGRQRLLISGFVAPDAGASRTIAVPIRVGVSGITEVVMPSLTNVDRTALDNALMG
jgi:malate/lactate dehydrogenase